MTKLKKALIYLGLGPDEDYEQFDDDVFEPVGDDARAPSKAAEPVRPVEAVTTAPERARSSSVRLIPSEPTAEPLTEQAAAANADSGAVNIVESNTSTPHLVVPTSFNDAQAIGDRFRSAQAVIINFEPADQALQRRLIDFASGLCYGLGGRMDRVADRVYLLTPANVDVLEADIRRVLR